ncbi:transposase [Sphingobium ummariense RL-3]|uniref:Transposase n=1 Tax=Sphingobium ummariense RL-3 TaxID=1346791 RepID=T0J7X2_9SPHN|nr:transposase [Sphingobium ummariense RL-3]
MGYSSGCHTTFHHRYHLVWAPKYRFKVLHGEVRLRVREIIRQVCAEMGVTIVHGVLSRDHVHMFVEIPPHVSVSDFVRRAKGRSSRKIQQEFEHIRKRYWGHASGSAVTSPPRPATSPMTSSCVTSTNMATRTASAPRHDPTGVSRSVIQPERPKKTVRAELVEAPYFSSRRWI